jgi:biotin operon repressor
MDEARIDRVAGLFRVLANPARLRILGALAERPHSGRELSERLGLTPPTVSHHMSRLVAAGIVTSTPRAQARSYTLDVVALREASTMTLPESSEQIASSISDIDDPGERDRAKVLRDFFDGERLKRLPAQRKKRVIVLEHVLTRFEPDSDYDERTVNDMLRPAHDDVATLRRELVDYGYMNRERGVYRVAAALPPRGPTVAQEVRADEHEWLEQLIAGATKRALTR